MKRLIHFFSLAVMTQVVLMLSQLILLPIQVRLWGQNETARWYSALALATMTYFVDCGLRTAGHAELIRANSDGTPADRFHFCQVWGWIRLLILLFTAALIGLDFAFAMWNGGAYSGWHAELILACAAETVLVIRIMYLDSLGRYRGAEASYFGFAVLRLSLSVPALLLFRCQAQGLAAIYMATAFISVIAQGQWLGRTAPLLRLNEKVSRLSWKVLALSRHTIAEPISNWMRLSLPVLVIAHIASPVAVTTYVALRSVFGAGRTTVQQLARVASVEVLRARSAQRAERAEAILNVFLALAIFFGTGVGLFVVIDNLRVLGLWMKGFDRSVFQQMALAFSLTAPFFSYQIPMSLMFRIGELAAVARRHYAFIAYSLLFGGVSLFIHSVPFYLALLVVAEMLLSVTFFAAGRANPALGVGRSGISAIRLAALMSLVICLVWLTARHNIDGWFVGVAFWQILVSIIFFLCIMSVTACLFYLNRRTDMRFLRRPSEVLIY